jgi:glycosyltransferase involved in cell wall biosynthesis
MENLLVSVIIPVYNNIEKLERCLEALQKQTYPKNCYEVIVIDNGSEENTELVTSKFNNVCLFYETQIGSYAARNKGINQAKGTIIAFTDSDCIPHLNWLENGISALLNNNNCGLVAGKINIFFQDYQSPTDVEVYELINTLKQDKNIKKFQAVTANLFTFMEVIKKVGYFDQNIKSGGDMEWSYRVHLQGYQLIYEELACVDHPARRTYSELSNRILRTTGGNYMLKQKQGYNFIQIFLDVCRDIATSLVVEHGVDNKLIRKPL